MKKSVKKPIKKSVKKTVKRPVKKVIKKAVDMSIFDIKPDVINLKSLLDIVAILEKISCLYTKSRSKNFLAYPATPYELEIEMKILLQYDLTCAITNFCRTNDIRGVTVDINTDCKIIKNNFAKLYNDYRAKLYKDYRAKG